MAAAAWANAARQIYPASRFYQIPKLGYVIPIVGLEIHVQVSSRTKLFSPAASGTKLGTPPNSAIALFDLAHPGTLPRPNAHCVAAAVRAGLALQGNIAKKCSFDRKHYFYADLPSGFQITQLAEPIVNGGALEYELLLRESHIKVAQGISKGLGAKLWHDLLTASANRQAKKTREDVTLKATLNRIQLEQDSGKSVHTLAKDSTMVDFNRAGVALLEIVTEPCFHTADEAGVFLRTLHSLLRQIGVSEGNIEEGHMRCDVNVSLSTVPQAAMESAQAAASVDGLNDFWTRMLQSSRPGPRVEMKNVASIKAVEKAVEHEIDRQITMAAKGEHVEQETRLFNALAETSTRLRTKEQAMDYRFMPEPDILPILVTDRFLAEQKALLPALPPDVKAKLVAVHRLTRYDASVLLTDLEAPSFYDEVVQYVAQKLGLELPPGFASTDKLPCTAELGPLFADICKLAANWTASELFGQLHSQNRSIVDANLAADTFGELVYLIYSGYISARVGKDVLTMLLAGQTQSPKEIVDERNWAQINDDAVLHALCAGVLEDASAKPIIDKYKAGSDRVFGSLVARVIEASGGKANPVKATAIMKQMLTATK